METLHSVKKVTTKLNKPQPGEVWYCKFGDVVGTKQGYRFFGPCPEDNYYFTRVTIIQPTRDMRYDGVLVYIVDDKRNKFLAIADFRPDMFVSPSSCFYKDDIPLSPTVVKFDFMKLYLTVSDLTERYSYTDETYNEVKTQIFKLLHPDLKSEV